jgi:hypothetical protein
MKYLAYMFSITILIYSCKSMKYSKSEPLSIDISDIEKISELDSSKDIKVLILGMKSPFVVSPELNYENDEKAIEIEEYLNKKIDKVKNFKNLTEVYLFNFHLAKIPNPILELTELETLQVNYFGHVNIDSECERLKKTKIKSLIIHSEMLSKEQIKLMKLKLPNVKIIDVDKM